VRSIGGGTPVKGSHRLRQKPSVMRPPYKTRGRVGVNPAVMRLGLVVVTLIVLWIAIIAIVVVAYRALP
jgi:hypothetical protein